MRELPIWTPYCGPGATPSDLLLRWNADPVLLAVMAVAAALMWRARARPVGWAGLAVAALLFLSPLCALSSALFAARTIHHVLLMAALAPLTAWALPKAGRSLGASTAASTAVFWAWHAPDAYAWAMSHDMAYWLMQASLAASATWFWRNVRAAGTLAAVGALLIATVQMGLLGALLTLADRALYAPHAATTLAWGLTPLQDQQMAGLLMWAPAAAVYLAVAIVLLARRLEPEPVVR
ncbi:cytochrome c oxidase assembly protein [Phenylobacterium sp. J426]|uniref:cytochrome c oxidase assembly protein n=1 Tax=Phenylobacterium sp. J426 TaxID=2898439 RepID=UPI002151CC79|nr:cytochrome c oxidase assembly protein [Phenylobacterium sp. J426]MCR5875328.1 cytochrome c oxidase assembly protein [Phenylobacterium sp. J426]